MQAVHKGVVEIAYTVRDLGDRYGSGKYRYDWITETGEESPHLYDSIESAIASAEEHF